RPRHGPPRDPPPRRAHLGGGRARKRSVLLFHGAAAVKGLRILILEDEPAEAELELAALAEGGFRCEPMLVGGRAAFEAAFEPGRFDLVIADYRLPDYTGLEALEHVRKRDALTPFVLVSGALGEE